MCGIVGYIGNQKATPILLNGLSALEYRGYDSAGIAVLEKNNICILKDKGRVKNLYNIDGINELSANIGIAHTRWATHGKPSKENAHPHSDNSNTFAVVHNGIIENFAVLKEFLINKGYTFYSETDTEIIPNLIHYYYYNNIEDDDKFLRAVKSACDDLKGSYSIEVLSKLHPDKLIVIRKDSPLVIGTSESENFVASDIPAVLSYTRKFYLLNDNEYAVIYKDKVEFYDNSLSKINKGIKTIDWDANAAEKDGFDDYMLKEIFEQPNSIRETIGSRFKLGENCSFDDLTLSKDYLNSLNKIYIIGCGTAMYAGLVGKDIIEKLCKIPVEVEIASEFRYRDPIIDNKTLCIYISQSGETADTIAALKLAKSKGAKTLSISNVIGSSITREADYTIYTHAGPEIAVASTKAYTSQVVLIAILAIHFAEILESADKEVIEHLKSDILDLPAKITALLNNTEEIQEFAKKIYTQKDIFFLGRGVDYHVALEGSLKLKEISYIHSEAYAAGELKHGPIALIENGITVVGIMTIPNLVEKCVSNMQEVISRGANTLIITNQNLPNSNFNYVINIPETNPLISPILSVIPMQLLAYYISKNKGLDVDKPRNLAKSVTVE
ncbi:MAG: glutamine--fructose-6-phosphate transaminase (isomerizing) [Clostridia bacterium]|jgi:glucosamine--fructose-6-phosphate aminotransferase (isomerizing)|nr:glutamine--fructose-6-phosphate transaminase (isomerizing) [Clostridia bacterium]HCF64816.1 glutamine--fructose-6-phosphate transaminase (isomerizing) [Clostridiales bacterium]